MSRIGKKPVVLPKGVTADVKGQTVKVKGPKGELQVTLPAEVDVSLNDGHVVVVPHEGVERGPAMWGLSRTLVNNLVTGVTTGFSQKLEIQGVGYRAAVQGKNLNLSIGFSHPVVFPAPDGITLEAPSATEILIKGADKQRVGETAAKIRAFRPPEPYKGKGVRYAGEHITLKEAKKA